MRTQALTAVKAGMTRLRDKGGASPDSLFDLLNGYVTAARTIVNRPGSRIARRLPPGTKGLVWFRGRFVVFATQIMDTEDPGVVVEVLRHPTSPTAELRDIHFAMPYLGYLYVVAEFGDGSIFHYWLEDGEEWRPGKAYAPGTLVRPVGGNGIAYRVASDRDGYVLWTPNAARQADDVVVPTLDNGFKYTVVDVFGASPRSGTTEPVWPTNPGERVTEDVNAASPFGAGGSGALPPVPPPAVIDRYGGSRGGNSINSDETSELR